MGRKPLDIDKIVTDLVMSDDAASKKKLAKKIWDIAYKKGIYPSSIHDYYMARGRNEFTNSTVPAINLRSMTYDLARALFRVGKKNNAKAFIFEIAKSEMGYTAQPPVEYSAVILGAAIKEGYSGPVFIQG
ncbi:MAG: aldolase, partial [Candidatus Omnitrophica bacterium]|nr:aldolase [Candidatus Omnitrophota bacterium]